MTTIDNTPAESSWHKKGSINPIWRIEEQATNIFISVKRTIIKEKKMQNNKHQDSKAVHREIKYLLKIFLNLTRPNVPNFSKILANIMDAQALAAT